MDAKDSRRVLEQVARDLLRERIAELIGLSPRGSK
jgi:hypothetical protein